MNSSQAKKVGRWLPKVITASQALSDAVVAAPTDEAYRKLKRLRDGLEQYAMELEKQARRDWPRAFEDGSRDSQPKE